MGALNSIHTKFANFTEEMEESDPEYNSTPQRSLRHKCLDPRSPTENIDRTPIIVDGTPNIYSSKAVRARIPSHIVGPIDPRSPSTEFTRTPLSYGSTSSESSDTPLKAPLEFKLPSNLNEDEMCLRNRNNPTERKDLHDFQQQSALSVENAAMSEGSLDDSLDTAPLLLEGSKKLNVGSDNSSQKKHSSVSEPDTAVDDLIFSQNKLKCQQVSRIKGRHQTSFPAKVRSPLSLVDNSPRVSLVRKKGISSGGKNESHVNVAVIDKENMCH